MREINVSATKKDKNHRSRSFGGTVWVTDREHHRWQRALRELITKTSRSMHTVIYQAAWLGFQAWKMALKEGKNYQDLESLLRATLASEYATQEDVPSDVLGEWARYQSVQLEVLKERDEALLQVLDQIGIEAFRKLTVSKDANFDPLAWMKRVGIAYNLTWHEKAKRYLCAYFAQNGEQPREIVIQWAKDVNLIGDDSSQLVVLASTEGFSGAAAHGKWGLPLKLRSQVINLDLDNCDASDTDSIVGLFGQSPDILIT